MKNILIARKDVRDTLSAIPKTIIKLCELFYGHGCQSCVIAENINRQLIESCHAIPVTTVRLPFLSTYQKRALYNMQVKRWRDRHRPHLTIGHGDIVEQDVLFMHNCVHKASELVHGQPLSPKNAIGRIHQRIMSQKRFKMLICNSQLMLDDFSARYDLTGIRTEIVRPELNTQALAAFPDAIQGMRSALRTEHGIAETDLLIGLITSGDFIKRNVANAIKAFAKLRETDRPLRLLVAGKNETQPYKTLCAELGIADRVVFGPAIPEVQRYYHAVDIFILPAFIEEFGKSVLEAMYCRKPVIVGKYVGAAEIFEGAAKEYIIEDVSSPDAIAGKITPLLASSELRSALGELNQATALKYKSEEQMRQYFELFEPMITENLN